MYIVKLLLRYILVLFSFFYYKVFIVVLETNVLKIFML